MKCEQSWTGVGRLVSFPRAAFCVVSVIERKPEAFVSQVLVTVFEKGNLYKAVFLFLQKSC
jgi:hypothetical protein